MQYRKSGCVKGGSPGELDQGVIPRRIGQEEDLGLDQDWSDSKGLGVVVASG